jgi:protein TonB
MFDQVVAGRKPSWKRRALLIVSLGLHGLAGVGLLIWSVLHIEELAPPAVSLTFFSAAPPPPPPPPPPAGRKPVEHKPKVQKVVQQPTEIPKLVQPPLEKPEEPEEKGEEGGVEGGVPGGVPGGVVGGVVGGVLGAPPPAPAAPKTVASFVLDAQRISAPKPHLPEDFVRAHARGEKLRAVYRICVRQDGHISDVDVLVSVGGVDPYIIDLLKRTWVYKAQPLPVCAVNNFLFEIN